MAVYDDQKDARPDDDLAREISDINTQEGKASKRDQLKEYAHTKALRAKELAKEETKEFFKEEAKDLALSSIKKGESYKFGSAYSGNVEGRLFKKYGKYILPRKRPMFGTLLGLAVFALLSYGYFSIMHGPMQLIHFANYLQETHFYVNHYFLNNRLGKAIIYASNAENVERRNLSYIGNQLADRYETRLRSAGISPEYDNTRRIRAFTIDPDTPEGKKAMYYLRDAGVDIDALSNGNEPFRVDVDRSDLGETSTRFRRQAISAMVGTLNMNGVSAASGARLLKLRAGVDFHPLRNLVRSADEDANAYLRRVREEIEKKIKYGVDAEGRPRTTTTTAGENETRETSAEDANRDITESTNDIVNDIDPNASNTQRAARIRANFTGGYGIASVFSMVCAVQKIGDAAAQLSYANINLPLIRTGMMVVAMGSQIQSGYDVNYGEIGAISESLYDRETNRSWVDARSIQTNMGSTPTGPDIPDSARPANGSEDLPVFFQTINDVVERVPGGNQFCDAVTTTVGGWALTIIGIGLTATGPVSLILNATGEFLTEYLVGQFLDDIIAWIARDQIDLNATGPIFGAYADYGSVLAANDTAISYGGIRMTDEEYEEIRAEQGEVLAMRRQQQSIFTRYFDLTNYHSFASGFVMNYVYPVNTSSISSTAQSAGNMFTKLSSNLFGLFTPSLYAESGLFDYGVPRFGFTKEEIDNPILDNPYENEAIVEEMGIARLNEEYGYPCFNTIINPTTYRLETVSRDRDSDGNPLPATKSYELIDLKCMNRENEELTRYRVYIADTVAVLTSACYEGIEIEGRDPCVEAGLVNTPIGGSNSSGGITGGVVTPSGGWVKPIESGYRITSNFGPRKSIKGSASFHYGTDLAAPQGTPYVAAKDGVVTFKGLESWGTYYIHIDHGGGVSTEYGHSYANDVRVNVGDRVTAGQVIALVGNQGEFTTGPHLHFNVKLNTEVRNNGYVDPVPFMTQQGAPL